LSTKVLSFAFGFFVNYLQRTTTKLTMATDAFNALPESFHDANQTFISPSNPSSAPGATVRQVNNSGIMIAAQEGNSNSVGIRRHHHPRSNISCSPTTGQTFIDQRKNPFVYYVSISCLVCKFTELTILSPFFSLVHFRGERTASAQSYSELSRR
jgi:hypothetical protein